jgi:addiction module RelE/StbE family toxin
MQILLHRDFKKRYKKLSKNNQKKFKERRNIFLENPFHSTLNNHELQGKYYGCRSINITGDIRAIYQPISETVTFFIAIGSHSELYE